jgi:hypothetical protein
VTNGGAGRGEKGLEQAKELLWEKGVRLFALIVSASDFRPLDNEGPHDLDQVARQTGGDSLFSKVGAPFSDGSKPSRSDLVLLEEGLRRVNNEIDNFYELEIELPDDISKTSEWDLKLVDQKDAKQRKIMVSYPREILPCNPSK